MFFSGKNLVSFSPLTQQLDCEALSSALDDPRRYEKFLFAKKGYKDFLSFGSSSQRVLLIVSFMLACQQ